MDLVDKHSIGRVIWHKQVIY